jgi:hypothetical protein
MVLVLVHTVYGTISQKNIAIRASGTLLQSKSNEKTVPLAKGGCIESQEHIIGDSYASDLIF